MQIPDHVQKGHSKAQSVVAVRRASEAAVAAGKVADSELLAAYMAYVKLEEAQGEPARVQVPAPLRPPSQPNIAHSSPTCFPTSTYLNTTVYLS